MVHPILRTIAFVIIAGAIIFNPWTVENLISPDGHFDFVWIFWAFFLIDIALLLFGVFLYRNPEFFWNYRKHLIAWSVMGVLLIFSAELVLRVHEQWYLSRTMSAMNIDMHPERGAVVSLGDIVTPVDDDYIIYILKQNLDVVFKGARVQTNSLGFRDSEFNNQTSQNVIRIVGLGDSVMFGWGVEESERYMDALERMLNQAYPAYVWKTDTLAIPGWNAANISRVLEVFAVPLNPDFVLYGYVENDVCLPGFLRQDRNFFSQHLRLLRLIDPYVPYGGALMEHDGRLSLYQICGQRDVPQRYKMLVGEEALTQSIVRMVDVTVKEDILLYVLTFGGFLHDLSDDAVEKIDNVQFRVMNMNDYFDSFKENNALYLSESDRHPSVSGHEKIAAFIFEEMRTRGIIDALIEKREAQSVPQGSRQ